MKPVRIAALVLAVGAVSAACTSDRDDADRELVVSAAASLTAAFTDIAADFEGATPGVRVSLSFGPSDGLATQIVEGAPVDVFASASPRWMDVVAEDGPGVQGRADFARNLLAILVPAGEEGTVTGVEDLAEPGVRLVLAAEGVPAGDYAREMLAKAGILEDVLANVVSNEEDVAAVVTKVATGEADAGIAYVTDGLVAVDDVTTIPVPEDVNVMSTYPIAVVGDSEEAELAQRFVDFVLDEGQDVLASYGFERAA